MPATSIPPAQVFISYSHEDKEWLDRLNVHLAPVRRLHKVAIWDDTLLKPGMQWNEEIKQALGSIRVAILLLSADFFSSEYIHNQELPAMLEAAADRGATILPIFISPCLLSFNEKLSAIQAVNSPDNPLVNMRPGKRDEVFVKVAKQVMDLLNQQAATQPAEALKPAARTPAPQPARDSLIKQVSQQLQLRYESVGSERFLIISGGDVYIQFYLEEKTKKSKAAASEIVDVEAVGNKFLPKGKKLSASQVNQLTEKGFSKPDSDNPNYSMQWELQTNQDLADMAIFAVEVLLDVYELPAETIFSFNQGW
jgi:hypothetical protein